MLARLTADALNELLRTQFPDAEVTCRVTSISDGELTMVIPAKDILARPGKFISGPTLMAAADTAMYLVVQGHTGVNPMAMTRSLTINFLSAAPIDDLHVTARLDQLGARTAIGTVSLRSVASADSNAIAFVSYALPATTS
jgi:acyl-coenzyme A thioesterase PaaI-like protein